MKPEIDNRDDMYRIAAENMLDTIVVVDNEAVVRYVSPSIETLTGYTVGEYEGMDAFGIIHPDDRDGLRLAHAEAVRSRTPTDVAYRVHHANGSLLHAEARVKPVLDADGRVMYVVAVVRDVTERNAKELLLQNILDNVNAIVWATDKDFTRHYYLSDNAEKMSGLSKEELMNRPIRMHDFIHPEDNELLMGEVKRSLDEGNSVRKEIRWIKDAPETRWLQMIVQPELDDKGATQWLYGMMVDITDKKRAELALEESEQRYKSLFEHNLDGVFSIELEGFYFVNANRAFEEIAGIEAASLTDRCFIGLIHDEDHASVYETLLEVMHRGQPKDVECRLARLDRGERIVSITFVPILLGGKLNGIHGILKDITQRKQEERELIRSEERSKFLQQSLNRFSNDLAGVMKVSELESRLLEEVEAVLRPLGASIEETPSMEESAGGPYDTRLVIVEKQQPVCLNVVMDRPLERMERVWLETSARYATILYDNLHLIEDLMRRLEHMVSAKETPKWMLRLLFNLSEKERAALSSDLHDTVLQDLIIWYRKLESLRSSRSFDSDTERDLARIEEGLLDAIHQIRITCNELRPPFLLKLGLVESLKSLFSYARMFANYEIDFAAEPGVERLNEEQIVGIYRIVQELLNNASKHAKAAKVTMRLFDEGELVRFSYSDDGVGIDLASLEGSFQHMGIAGIEKRVQSLEGEVQLRSAPGQGFHVDVSFPQYAAER